MAAVSIPLIFLFISFLNPSVSKCPKSFSCGILNSMEFPLAESDKPECGLFTVDCANLRIQLASGGTWYYILQRISANKFIVIDPVLENDLRGPDWSCPVMRNLSLPFNPSASFTFSPNLTFFICNVGINVSAKTWDFFDGYPNYTDCHFHTVFYTNSTGRVPVRNSGVYQHCTVVQIPVNWNQRRRDPMTAQFELEWNVSEACLACHDRGGRCLSNNLNEFQCKEGAFSVAVGIISGVVSMIVISFIAMVMIFYNRIRHTPLESLQFHNAYMKNEKNIELFLKNNGHFTPRRYKYYELKRITKSFNQKLGKGGYGSVYKGKLRNGRPVAVKILDETKDNVNEFMNEVLSISKTSHVNIVTLLGFCFEGPRRALIYEFMPNGSLDIFVNDTFSSSKYQFGWEKIFEIAVGIARGLEYLHRGCNTRILHLDIKPHNILLDKDLNPKISDFGLAKLCPNRSSIVSMLVARGTIGYIAPEVFCKNFGEVSHKSDVYSYGMMVLEIIGGKQNPDTLVKMEHSSEMYFPDYIYKQLETDAGNHYNLEGIMNENGWKISKRKMTIVGLWCIQTDPKNRPPMNRVLEMLESNLESLEIPPKPHLSSPRRSAPSASISEYTSTF